LPKGLILPTAGISIKLLTVFFLGFIFSSCIKSTGIRDIGSEELKKMIDNKSSLLIVDTRTDFEFTNGHIPGTINVPQKKFSFIKTICLRIRTSPLFSIVEVTVECPA